MAVGRKETSRGEGAHEYVNSLCAKENMYRMKVTLLYALLEQIYKFYKNDTLTTAGQGSLSTIRDMLI